MPLDPSIIAAAVGATAGVTAAVLIWVRGRRTDDAGGDDEPVTEPGAEVIQTGLDTSRPLPVSPGEREAAWSAARAASIADALRSEVERARSELATSQAALASAGAAEEEIRSSLADADREIAVLRSQVDAAETRVAELESRLAEMPDSSEHARLRRELEQTRAKVASHAAAERDLRQQVSRLEESTRDRRPGLMSAELAAARRRVGELEALLADTAAGSGPAESDERLAALRAEAAQAESRLRAQLDAARADADRSRSAIDELRSETDRRVAAAAAEVARQTARITELESAVGERSGDRDRLVAREAEIADLETRLAAVSAARESELRRLNDKISSMERVYVEVEAGERRIEALEDEVKTLAEARDEAVAELRTAEAELTRLRREQAESVAAADRLAALQDQLSAAQARIADLERTAEGPLQAELDRVRSTLAAERERSARMQRRSVTGVEPGTASSYAEFDRRLRRRIEEAVESATGPLLDRMDHLREVVAEKERRIASLTASRVPDDHDDLTLIRGIGPKIAEILHDLGVTTFHQIAAFSDEDVIRVGSRLPVYGGRITDDEWIEQAKTLAGDD